MNLLENGKLPPQNMEMEELVLGAILINKDAYDEASAILTKHEMFYSDAHQRIYKAMGYLHKAKKPIDMATVHEQMKKTNELIYLGETVGMQAFFLSRLTSRLASSANIQAHAAILVQKFIQRELIRIATETVFLAYEDVTDGLQLLEDTERKVAQISEFHIPKGVDYTPNVRTTAAYQLINDGLNQTNEGLTGITSGLKAIDEWTGGLQKGDLIIIAGKPGTYKTALSLFIAHKAAHDGTPAYIAEQEMTETQTGLREIGMFTGLNTKSLRTGLVSNNDLVAIQNAMIKINNTKVYVEHQSGLTAATMIKKIKRLKKEHDLGLAIIDYLQLSDLKPKYKGENKADTIADICKDFKILAKELNIPIIVLSQFNRESTDNKGKSPRKPNNSMLLGSGGIEANADVIILLYNQYKEWADLGFSKEEVDAMTIKGTDEPIRGTLELLFTKHRMGSTGSLHIGVRPASNQFFDLQFVLDTFDKVRILYPSANPDQFIEPKALVMNNDFENEKNTHKEAWED